MNRWRSYRISKSDVGVGSDDDAHRLGRTFTFIRDSLISLGVLSTEYRV